MLAGNVEGTLQLWEVQNSIRPPPTVTLNSTMKIDDGAVTSIHFNKKMELVKTIITGGGGEGEEGRGRGGGGKRRRRRWREGGEERFRYLYIL